MRMTRETFAAAFCAILLSACGGTNGLAPQIARSYQSTATSRLSGSAKLETLYNFTYKDDGSNPIGGLAADSVGNLYVGTIAGGGAYDSGTVDELLALGSAYNEKTLVRFDGKNGADFVGDPIVDRNGTVFGNTDYGGRYGAGAAISITRDARERVIWSFGATKTGGVFPLAGMVRDRHRALYGTTELGGPFGGGTVYRLSPSGRKYTETILHAFGGGADGKYLSRALTLAPDGSIYGTTSGGGNGCHNGCGIVFKLTPQGTRYTESILWNFHGGGDGSGPSSGLTFDTAGSMYGVTDFGGGNGCADGYGCGVVYKLTPSSSGYTERVL